MFYVYLHKSKKDGRIFYEGWKSLIDLTGLTRSNIRTLLKKNNQLKFKIV